MITKEIADIAISKSQHLTVKDVCLGLGYTAVQLSDDTCGACFTFRNDLGPKCGVIPDAGSLIGKSAASLIEKAMSVNLAEASLGVATINAVLNGDFETGNNAIDEMDIRPEDTLGLIGNFVPILNKFKDRVKDVYVFERVLTDDYLIPDWAEEIYLPKCDVVVITGVTFINKTIDHILEMSKNAKEIVIMGPSTCMAPDILKERGVTLLAGSRVSNPEMLLKTVAQGGGGLDVAKHMERLSLRLDNRRD